MSKGDEELYKRIMFDLNNEISDQITNSEKNESLIKEKLATVQEKLISVLKLKCSEAFNALEKSKFQTNKLDGDQMKYAKELQLCAHKYEFGLREQMGAIEKQSQGLTEFHSTCTRNCSTIQSEEAPLKACLKRCYDLTFSKANDLHKKLEGVLDNTISKLNKL